MTKMPWRTFLFYNLTGSAIWAPSYILIGYFFGKKWKVLEGRLDPTVLCPVLAGLALIVLGVLFRRSVSGFLARAFSIKHSRK
jgi:membrane protein DedA with SNARE-associated domain